MSYQPPGPYPVFPQQQQPQYGLPAKPPIPETVRRAFILMLVGAGLEVVNVATSFILQHQVEDKINQAILNGQQTANSSASIAGGAIGGIIGVGLWIWMAFANRGGANWARITGTVFFGISCLGLLVDIAAFHLIDEWLGGVVFVTIIEALLSWLVGLFTLILLWRRQSSAYFQPTLPQQPYPYPGVPGGFIPGAPMQPGDVQQQPGDPWATPGGQNGPGGQS